MQGELSEGIEQLKREVDKATAEQDETPFHLKLVREVKLVVRPEGRRISPRGADWGPTQLHWLWPPRWPGPLQKLQHNPPQLPLNLLRHLPEEAVAAVRNPPQWHNLNPPAGTECLSPCDCGPDEDSLDPHCPLWSSLSIQLWSRGRLFGRSISALEKMIVTCK